MSKLFKIKLFYCFLFILITVLKNNTLRFCSINILSFKYINSKKYLA